MRFSWDDLAVFLALLREGSTNPAATVLGISQPTVVRRLAALEQALGLPLFTRTPSGLTATADANSLRDAAEAVEQAACRFRTEVEALTGNLSRIRLTFLDHFEGLLIPILRDFHTRWPGVETELLASDLVYDIARGEADIGIRGRWTDVADEVVVRDLPPSGWTVYAAAHLPEEARPRSPEEVAGRRLALVGGVPATLPVFAWLASLPSPHVAVLSAIATGSVISALPCTVGDCDPAVVRCFAPLAEWDAPITLVGRRTILRQAPARDLFDSIAGHFARHPHLLTGRR